MTDVRLTLISSATQEFPNNTNVDFKIRLAEPVRLKTDEKWQAAMASLSTPNSPATYMKAIDVKRTDTLFAYGLRVANDKFPSSDPKHKEDILDRRMTVGEVFLDVALDNFTGVEFWSRMSETLAHMQTWHMMKNAEKNDHWAKVYARESVTIDVDVVREGVRWWRDTLAWWKNRTRVNSNRDATPSSGDIPRLMGGERKTSCRGPSSPTCVRTCCRSP